MISPPRPVEARQLAGWLAAAGTATPVARRDYTHYHRDRMITVRTMILPAPMEGAAYA
jgi:hypothetical protein